MQWRRASSCPGDAAELVIESFDASLWIGLSDWVDLDVLGARPLIEGMAGKIQLLRPIQIAAFFM